MTDRPAGTPEPDATDPDRDATDPEPELDATAAEVADAAVDGPSIAETLVADEIVVDDAVYEDDLGAETAFGAEDAAADGIEAEADELDDDTGVAAEPDDYDLAVREVAGEAVVPAAATTATTVPGKRRAAQPAPTRAPSPSEIAVHVREDVSKVFVIGAVAVFVVILLNGLVLGRGGFLTPIPTETPSPSPTASASAAASPSASAGASASASAPVASPSASASATAPASVAPPASAAPSVAPSP
jgi:hypothetical protein